MTAIYSNGVRVVLIEKLDRLARDLMVQEATIADLQKHGFTLISVAEPDRMASDPNCIPMPACRFLGTAHAFLTVDVHDFHVMGRRILADRFQLAGETIALNLPFA